MGDERKREVNEKRCMEFSFSILFLLVIHDNQSAMQNTRQKRKTTFFCFVKLQLNKKKKKEWKKTKRKIMNSNSKYSDTLHILYFYKTHILHRSAFLTGGRWFFFLE